MAGAIAGLGVVGTITGGPSAKATETPAGAQRHVVRAGWTNPGGSAEPFVYTAYYPDHLRVHSGDTVEWQFGQSYAGWHTVSFVNGPKPKLWRSDEYPDVIGFDEAWTHGHDEGDEDVKCGRKSWLHSPDRPDCDLTIDHIDEPGEQFSSGMLDRFASTADGGAFVSKISLPEGTYSYFCKLHEGMEGTIEVLPEEEPLANPTEVELVARRDADFAAAKARVDEVEKGAWNPVTREWTVLVGTETADRRVGIYDYLPGLVNARRGDKVKFVAGTSEPNSVTFTSAPQGGFNSGGTCGANSCTPGTGAPHGLVGFAYPWFCDYDDPAAGAPGVPLAWIPSRVADGVTRGAIEQGCVEQDGTLAGVFEMAAAPTTSKGQRAPGNLVVDRNIVHNSGIIFDATLPDGVRRKPDGSYFPSTFEARFPTAGTFPYFCIAHEFMKGQINVV